MKYTKAVLGIIIGILVVMLFLTTNNLRLRENEYLAFEKLHNATMEELNKAKINYGEVSFEKKELQEEVDRLNKLVNDMKYAASGSLFDYQLANSEKFKLLLTGEKSDYKPLYWYDVMDDEMEVASIVDVRGMSIKEQVQTIADDLSKQFFGGLSITPSLADENGKSVLTVVLSEASMLPSYGLITDEKSWKTGYFQGSTGGMFTYQTLVKSFLQEEYEGVWIDQLRFEYDDVDNIGFQHMGDFFDTTFERTVGEE